MSPPHWRFVFGLTSLLVEENFFDDFAFFSCHKSNPQVMEEDEKDGDIGGELERRERCYIQIIFDENRSKPHPQNRRQGEESIYFPKKKMGSKGIKEMISSRGITIHNHSFP